MICQNCNRESAENAKYCEFCGAPMQREEAVEKETLQFENNENTGNTVSGSYTYPQAESTENSYYSESSYSTGDSQWAVVDENNNRGVISMVLGIVSIVLSCCCGGCGGIISLVCGIVAVYLANVQKKRGHYDGYTQAGFICGIIGIVFSALCLVSLVVYLIIYGVAGLASLYSI